MANRYFVGDTSSAWGVANNWATISGGAGGAGVPTDADDVFLDGESPNCTTAGTIYHKSLTCTGYTGTFTVSNYTAWMSYGDVLLVAGMTFTPGQDWFYYQNANGNLTSAGNVFYYVYCDGGDITLQDNLSVFQRIVRQEGSSGSLVHNNKTVTLTGSGCRVGPFTFYNLTKTGLAFKTDFISIEGDVTVANTLTLNGNSATNRLLVYSSVLGTQRTITAATVSVTNADFRDIKGAGAGSWDLSAIAGGSGDCGGNTDITFTTADDWYWKGSGVRNFSDYTYWYTATNGGGSQMASTRCPLPQDTCYFDADSIDEVTRIGQDMPRLPSIDGTGASAFTFDSSNINQTTYGGLTFASTLVLWTGGTWTFGGRGSYVLSMGGQYFSETTIIDMIGGTLTLGNHLFHSANFTGMGVYFMLNHGTFDAVSYNVTVHAFRSDNSNTRALYLGSGTWFLKYGETLLWDIGITTNLTFDAETSTISFETAYMARTFEGGGLTYYNWTTPTSTGIVTITGSNTFNVFTINAPNTVKFTSGTTQTVNSFVIVNDAANEVTLSSVTADSIATISDADGGTNVNDYLNVIDITAAQENTFYYGVNGSADNATNWLESAGIEVRGKLPLFRPIRN